MKLEFDWNVLAKYAFLRGRWIWEPDDFQKQAGWKHDPVFCAYQVAPDGWRFHQCSRKAKHTIGTMDGENHGYCKQHFYMVKSELADRGLILVNLEVDEDGQLQANVLEPKPEPDPPSAALGEKFLGQTRTGDEPLFVSTPKYESAGLEPDGRFFDESEQIQQEVADLSDQLARIHDLQSYTEDDPPSKLLSLMQEDGQLPALEPPDENEFKAAMERISMNILMKHNTRLVEDNQRLMAGNEKLTAGYQTLTTIIDDLSAAALIFIQELDRFEHDTLTTAAIEKFRAAVQKALKLTAGAILLLAFILLSTTTAHAQERYDALEQPHYGPLSATAAARQQEIIRRHYDLSATAAAAPAGYFSRYENTINPERLYGHAWGVELVQFDFLTGDEWTDKARQCEFVIGVHSPPGMPHAEAFPVINAQYYTPVFVPGLYWSYQYDSFFENDDWFFIHLNGPPIEGTAGNEGWIRWWLDISHAPLVNKDFYMNHWTTWYNTAYCQDEDFGDPWYFWHTYVVFVDEHGHPHYNYLFLPSIN